MVNQKAAVCKTQTKSMERTAGTGVGRVALGDKLGRLSGVDGIVLCGYIIDGCVSDQDGEDEADDGCEYLAAIGAGLSFL